MKLHQPYFDEQSHRNTRKQMKKYTKTEDTVLQKAITVNGGKKTIEKRIFQREKKKTLIT